MNVASEAQKISLPSPLPDSDRMVKALGSPVRWKMLQELSKGEPRTIGELASAAGCNYDNAGRHLIVLRKSYLLPDIFRPSKISAFERELEDLLRSGNLKNEVDVMRICFEHGVKRQHAEPVLAKLKRGKIISADFRVPDVRNLYSPRPVQLITVS